MCTKLREYLDREEVVGKRLADRVGITAQFLSQIAAGQRPAPPRRCIAIEQATDYAVRLWDLRPDDWWQIWPDRINTKGAPSLQQALPDAA